MNNEPYITTERIIVERKYNPEYGDNRVCKCGHPYHRHFDSYEDMQACGCKYCGCYTFEEYNPEVDCMTLEALRDKLGLHTHQPLRNAHGTVAYLIGIDGQDVIMQKEDSQETFKVHHKLILAEQPEGIL